MIQKGCYSLIRKFWGKTKIDFGKYCIVTPMTVSDRKSIPDNIKTPSWYSTGVPLEEPNVIDIKNAEQISKLRKSCQIASKILHHIGEHIKVGQTTDEIDCLVHELSIQNKCYPSPLNYRGFPKSVCTSVNNVVCHGIPDNRPLEDGDIINVDVTVYHENFHGDVSKTFLVGNVDEKGRKLVEATEMCLNEAIATCKPGQSIKSIGNLIEYRAKALGFTVVPALTGHGIGEYFHGPPDIFHCSNNYPGVMVPGMTFTIEPALAQGSGSVEVLEDGWSVVTVDNGRSAQCEHTVLITEQGCEILTLLK